MISSEYYRLKHELLLLNTDILKRETWAQGTDMIFSGNGQVAYYKQLGLQTLIREKAIMERKIQTLNGEYNEQRNLGAFLYTPKGD